ncbi:response regulator receiver modulated diguanylate phosphodiesterase [Paracidovorax avenae ATCC 19860]|uniref:Response regulator receiver modulated diguanylate phosphodiesterase n=1 Tax=Paracidovorax avenae (strain ATCC 19860 / DSM 7227 / CCUG 15838 / JCM 20985 / LMG 2117 / NCPPB 1011) TaxID=643561 RepID=F0QAX1_PARA1|nr:EAL domain-containing response regulator [Paracidovorax avenae]ADX47359.1 response regulator receiver modulated diguanylate phosphodiesterase [Paracidovorax avenae ATCC 19860]
MNAPDPSLPSAAACSVLVVDDSTPQRQHAVRLCHDLGIGQVLEACHGRHALEVIAAMDPQPSLVVVDLEMPEMDGIELIEALQQQGLRIPILLLSAHGDALLDSVQSLGTSVVRGLHKPLASGDLQAVLEEVLSPSAPAADRRRAPRMPIDAAMLEQAIREGGITPHFQPKADTRTGMLRGVEALARWNHPVLGMVPPDEFIPLAESAGLIHALTLSMMERSFLQCAAWQSRGMRLTLSINLSPQLLALPDIVNEICARQLRYGLAPSQLMLEVTEGSMVETSSAAHSALVRLRLKGFGLSIDDYGTGFSSLQQLSRIPFSELKIDRSFVHGAHRRKSLRVILESALDLARRLNLSTVAEGVEHLEDWRLLQDFGCTSAQGWLIAKAMPGEDLPTWNRTHRTRLDALRLP